MFILYIRHGLSSDPLAYLLSVHSSPIPRLLLTFLCLGVQIEKLVMRLLYCIAIILVSLPRIIINIYMVVPLPGSVARTAQRKFSTIEDTGDLITIARKKLGVIYAT